MTATSDVIDEHGDVAEVCQMAFRQFGHLREFEGPIRTRVALVGEIVASLARDSGWAGIVINGCVRDVAALRALDLGVKAIGSTPRPSGKSGTGEIDVPVTFGGVTFRPGDMLFSDDDGVVTLSPPA